MAKMIVAVEIAQCPKSGQIYGVRIEERNKKWYATWAFAIKPETAKKEGYSAQQFPPDILYDNKYPGCPYCKKHEDLSVITKPKEQPKKNPPKICVTSPGYDNIGKILDSMKIKYDVFNSKQYDCDVLFLNCGTKDKIDTRQLESFVKKGGCLYASDLVENYLAAAFPGLFNFGGRVGEVMSMPVDVIDSEMKEISGNRLNVTFDLPGWVVINGSKGEVLLRSAASNKAVYANKPVMVKASYGKGLIFYTSFHNHALASEKEKAWLQLLILKQLGASSNTSLKSAGADLGVDIDEIKSKFKFDF